MMDDRLAFNTCSIKILFAERPGKTSTWFEETDDVLVTAVGQTKTVPNKKHYVIVLTSARNGNPTGRQVCLFRGTYADGDIGPKLTCHVTANNVVERINKEN